MFSTQRAREPKAMQRPEDSALEQAQQEDPAAAGCLSLSQLGPCSGFAAGQNSVDCRGINRQDTTRKRRASLFLVPLDGYAFF